MRLLMLNNEFPPLGGGTGTVNEAMLRRLAGRSDIDVELVTSTAGATREEEQFAPNIRLIRLPVPNRDIHHASNRALIIYALRACRESLQRHRAQPYDCCLAWGTVPAGAVALTLRRLTGLRYVLRVSGPDIPGFERRYRWLYSVLTPLIRAAWGAAEKVVAKCRTEADMIGAVAPGTGVHIVANGVDLAAFDAPVRAGDGPLRLLSVARLIERKGQHHLLEALARLIARGTPATLELVGTGDARSGLEHMASSLGIADRVRFAGYVPRESISTRYAAAQVFVLPSFNEGMSVATLEAMASGLPVVVTRVGGVDDLVAEGVNGLTFDWGDIEALTSCLSRLANAPELRLQMGSASRRRAERFSWDEMTRAYVTMFENMHARRGARLAARRTTTS